MVAVNTTCPTVISQTPAPNHSAPKPLLVSKVRVTLGATGPTVKEEVKG